MSDSVTGLPTCRPPRLLLILGAPASGKSELADRLAARYHVPALRKDEIKELLFDALGAGGPGAACAGPDGWSRALSNASFALLFAFAPRLLCSGRPLLLEGNFRPGEHEPALAALLAQRGAQLAQVLCHARAATRAARLSARALDPYRHRGHRDQALAAAVREAEAAAPAAPAPGLDGFLALPGARLRFDSDASRAPELTALYAMLDPWMTAASHDHGA